MDKTTKTIILLNEDVIELISILRYKLKRSVGNQAEYRLLSELEKAFDRIILNRD